MLLEYQGQIYRDPVSGQNMHEALGALIQSPQFAQMPDPQRAATIKDTVSRYRRLASASVRSTIIQNEAQQRIDGDQALVDTFALIGAKSADNLSFMYLDRPNEVGNWHYYVQIYFNVGNMSTQQVTARYGKLVELKNNTSAIGGGTGSGSGVGSGGGSSGGGGGGEIDPYPGGGGGTEMPVIT